MNILRIALQVLLVLSSFFLIMSILLHKGKGGGLSDMFGGGVSSSAGTSGVAERNLDRITVGVALVWVATIVGLGLLTKFFPDGGGDTADSIVVGLGLASGLLPS